MSDRPAPPPGNDELLDLPAPERHGERWTLLLVGESGRVLRLRRIQGWITLLAALPVIAIAIAVAGFLRSEVRPPRDQAALGEVSRLEAEVRLLRQENQRLRASRERDGGIDPVYSEDTSVEMPDEAAGDGIEEVRTPQEPSPSDEAMADEIDDPAERRSLVGEDTSGEDEAPAPVAVRDLVVDVDADRGTVRVRFKVFNQQAEGEAFSGYAFVILKGGDAGPDRWVVFPETNVSPQGTVSYQSGFDFHISNYMTIDFQPQPAGNTETPTVATVLVYDASGRRVLQSDFQLDADR